MIKLHKIFFIALFGLSLIQVKEGLAQKTAFNLELHGSIGLLGVRSVAGCCKSNTPQLASAISVRLPHLFLDRDIEISGTSTGKYSEFTMGPSFYIYGERPQEDPGMGYGIEVVRVTDWSILTSLGAGFLIHSTRTKEFDLPAIVVGTLIFVRSDFVYSLNNSWSIGLLFSSSVGLANNYLSLSYLVGLGPRYRF